IRPIRKRNHFSSSSRGCASGDQTISLRISRLSGPWTAMLCSSSVVGLTQTRRPSRSASRLRCTPSYSSPDRKSTRLNSSHLVISYAVFCLKKKKQNENEREAAQADTPLEHDE